MIPCSIDYRLRIEEALGACDASDLDPEVRALFSQFFGEVKVFGKQSISAIVAQLDELQLTEGKVDRFCQSILAIRKEPVLIEFFCDIDAHDFNEAILIGFEQAVQSASPIITTTSLFKTSIFSLLRGEDNHETRKLSQVFKLS